MWRILQTCTERGKGNCQQAALASLLEVPLDAVPDFVNAYPSEWDQKINAWLYDLGLFSCHVRSDPREDGTLAWLTDNTPCIVAVKSVTTPGIIHSVIYHKGHVVHDPHPSQSHRWRQVEIVGVDIMVPIRPRENVDASHHFEPMGSLVQQETML